MENLAGVNECDAAIRTELSNAGCPTEHANASRSEVPYSIVGRIGDWKLIRAWRYWIAIPTKDKNGLPLSVASVMHEKKYPKEQFENCTIENYGTVIRSAGHCGCPHPREWALPTKDDMVKLGIERKTYAEIATFLNEKDRGVERYIECYHIDTQEGLNEFVRTIRSTFPKGTPTSLIELGRTFEPQYERLKQFGFPLNETSKHSTPTLAFSLKWLREVKHIDISVNKVLAKDHPNYGLYVAIVIINNVMRTDVQLPAFTKFEMAESSGINYAIDFLLSKN